jgi:flagellar motor protein MotB
MITLLLSFFVIFYNADFKETKIEKLNQYLGFQIENLKPSMAEVSGGKSKQKEKVEISDLGDFDIKVEQVDENLVVTFGKFSFFDSGKTEIRKEASEVLRLFAEKYLPFASKYSLSIKGFTDKKPVMQIERAFKDNLELSALRAISAMRLLRSQGIPLARMEIAGIGELKSIAKVIPSPTQLTNAELNAISRTVVLVIKPEKENFL